MSHERDGTHAWLWEEGQSFSLRIVYGSHELMITDTSVKFLRVISGFDPERVTRVLATLGFEKLL